MKFNSHSAKPNAGSSITENIKLTGRFLQTLIMKLGDIVDLNPAKMVLSLATAILEIKDVSRPPSDRILTDYHPRWWETTRILSYSG